jgi:hypothetical protein
VSFLVTALNRTTAGSCGNTRSRPKDAFRSPRQAQPRVVQPRHRRPPGVCVVRTGQIVALDLSGKLVWSRHLGASTRRSTSTGGTAARRRSSTNSLILTAITCRPHTC